MTKSCNKISKVYIHSTCYKLILDTSISWQSTTPVLTTEPVLLSSRPGLSIEDTSWRSWMIRSWPWEKSLGLAKEKTFPPRSRPCGCCTCMLCSHSRCHITVCHLLLRNVSQTCM